jgi:DNA-binding NarL/FixJ family response regulator
MIVDDHAIVRKGLKQIFEVVPDMTVVAEAADGNAAMRTLREAVVDLLLLDMTMPGVCGDDLVSRIHGRYPELPILVLSMHNEPQFAQLALKAGARGYLSKDHEPEVLIDAVRRVVAGGRYIDPLIAEQMVFNVATLGTGPAHERLSEREFQILRLIARGMRGNEIAAQLSISSKTVSTHKTNLMEKMGFATPADIFRYASDHGLVD